MYQASRELSQSTLPTIDWTTEESERFNRKFPVGVWVVDASSFRPFWELVNDNLMSTHVVESGGSRQMKLGGGFRSMRRRLATPFKGDDSLGGWPRRGRDT